MAPLHKCVSLYSWNQCFGFGFDEVVNSTSLMLLEISSESQVERVLKVRVQ